MRKLERMALAACMIVGLLCGLAISVRADEAPGPPPGKLSIDHFQFDSSAERPELYGRFLIKNHTGIALRNIKVLVQMRDANGKVIPGAAVEARPVNDPQVDFMPAGVMEINRYHSYQWRWNQASGGTTYAAPFVTVTGTYGPEGQGKDFTVTLQSRHPDRTTY